MPSGDVFQKNNFPAVLPAIRANNQTTVELNNNLKNTKMKNLERLSKKATEFCYLSGFDADKVREAMKSSSFAIQICENKSEMDDEGVAYAFPYVIWNPYNIDID